MNVRSGHRQRGATLFVVLILLIGLAWFALSAFRISSQHLQIVGNSQADIQATAAAQRAIEETISSNLFTKDPAAVAQTPIETDVDGDSKTDFTAKLDPAPKCIRVRPIKTMELDIALPPIASASNRQVLAAISSPFLVRQARVATRFAPVPSGMSPPRSRTPIRVPPCN